jgi:hypothetical protein
VATSIVTNGRRTQKPGAKSEVKSQTGAGLGPSARGIIAILGTAEGGRPLSADTTSADATTPEGVRRKWRGGNIRKAALFAFAPSLDDAIPGGAQQVIGVKVNPATQSTLQLFDAEGSPTALATSRDYGAFTERISVDVETGTSLGKRLIYDLDNEPQEFDNVGGGSIMRILTQTRWPSVAGVTPATLGEVRRFLYEMRAPGASARATDAAAAAQVYTNGVITVVSTNAGDTQDVTVYGVNTSTGLAQSEVITLNGVTPVSSSNSYSRITGIVASREPVGQVNLRDAAGTPIVWLSLSNTQRRAGVVASASRPGIAGRAIRVWAAFDPSAGATRKVVVRGLDASASPISEVVTLNGATPITLSGLFDQITQVEVGDVAPATTVFVKVLASAVDYVEHDALRVTGVVASPLASPTAQAVTFTPTGAGTFTATVRGTNQLGAYVTEDVSVTNAPVNTTATFRKVLGIQITSAPTMPIAISGGFVGSLAVSATSFGSATLDGLTTIQSGSPVFIRATSVVGRIAVAVHGIDAAGSAAMVLVDLVGNRPALVAAANAWLRLTRIDYLQLPNTVSAEVFSPFLTASGTTYNTVSKMIAKLTADSRIEASLQDASEENMPFSQMDASLIASNVGDGADFYGDLRKQITITDEVGGYVILTRDAWSAGGLGNIGSPRFLTGGIEGTTTINEWIEAFRVLKKRRANTVIVLSEDPAVHQLLFNYVKDACGFMENECNGYVGIGTTAGAGETRANIKSRIRALQGRWLSFHSQEFLRADPDTGEATWWPPYMLTAISAGMQAGSAIGEPLTRKLLQVDDIRNDVSWNVEEDVEEMISAGLMMVENDDGANAGASGIAWVRSITGHLADNDPVFCEMSAVESMNESVYALRNVMNREVGKRALGGSVATLKSIAASELDRQEKAPEIRGWRPETLVVEEIGDTFPTTVEIQPILAINFIPITVNVTVARSST